jgi:hypothetical protein
LTHRKAIYTFPNPFHRRIWGGSPEAQREIDTSAGADILPAGLAQSVAHAPVEWVVLCPGTLRYPLSRENFVSFLAAMLNSPSYGIVFAGRDVVLLQRGADHRAGLHLLERVSGTQITDVGGVDRAIESWSAAWPTPP